MFSKQHNTREIVAYLHCAKINMREIVPKSWCAKISTNNYVFLSNLIWAIELKKVIFWWDYSFKVEYLLKIKFIQTEIHMISQLARYFIGIKFRGFRGFCPFPRNLIPQRYWVEAIREIKSPRNVLKNASPAKILKNASFAKVVSETRHIDTSIPVVSCTNSELSE